MFKKITTAAAVALVGLGVGAAGASAASISGGAYTAASSFNHTFTVGGSYTHTCSNVTFEGDATGASSSTFTPVLDGCSFLGFPAFDSPSGPWTLTVGDDLDGFGDYPVSIDIPAGTTTTLQNPLMGYTISIVGPQTIPNAGTISNGAGGAQLSLGVLDNVAFVASSAPFSSGSNLVYRANGPMTLPGVTVQ